MLKSWQIEGFGEEQKGILMIVWQENRTITGKKMNRGIYAIIVIGESLSGEKNLVLILEIIRICGKNVIGENKKMHYVVSDIHNDYQKFCELLKMIEFSKEDKMFILGDLFDRSDYNLNPVDLYFKVMELGDNCSMIRGNHDEWLAAYILYYYQMPEWKRRKTEPYQYNTFRCLTRRLVPVDVRNLAKKILTWPFQLSVQVNNEKYLPAHAMTSKPECTENKYYYLMGNEMNTEYLHNGIEGYISVCGHAKSEVVILGAFGCGAFANPPELVAYAMNAAINEHKYDFETIELAIYCPPRDTSNYEVFAKEFSA